MGSCAKTGVTESNSADKRMMKKSFVFVDIFPGRMSVWKNNYYYQLSADGNRLFRRLLFFFDFLSMEFFETD